MISCKSCCFYHHGEGMEEGWGSCHRFPKTEGHSEEHWCGEYVRGPNRQEATKMQDLKNADDRQKFK